jgi:hypothetical protein
MIKELLKTEVDDAIEKIKDFEGLNLVYKNGNSGSIFNFTDNQISVLFDFGKTDSISEVHRRNNLIKWNQIHTLLKAFVRYTPTSPNTFSTLACTVS